MTYLPYYSISPTLTFHRYPYQTKIEGEVEACVTINDVKGELPVHDNNSDSLLTRKILSVQHAIERYINRDTTLRQRVSLWILPERRIKLPFGPHVITGVEQEIDGEFKSVDYTEQGGDYKEIVLNSRYPTRVTYNSGHETVPEFLQDAVIQEVAFYFKNRNDPNEAMAESKGGLSLPTLNLLSSHV